MHTHTFKRDGNFKVCSECGVKRMLLRRVDEDLLRGTRTDGTPYSVRSHRKSYFLPTTWVALTKAFNSDGTRFTAEVLIQTGARINETRFIEDRDIDVDRNTLKLRVTKRKARKAGEERGIPRTIPISSDFVEVLKKHFRSKKKIDIVNTSSFNKTIKAALKRMGIKDYYMYSAHSIRKTHGNWLKIMGNAGMMKCDASEICLRLGHTHETFLKDYGSSGVMNKEDLILIRKIMGDLYQ